MIRSRDSVWLVCASFTVFIVVMAIGLSVLTVRWDFFPFYRWDMFSRIHPILLDYEVRLVELDGVEVSHDIYVERDRYIGRPDRQPYFTIESLGWAWDRKQMPIYTEKERKILSTFFFASKKVEYELYRRTADRVKFLSDRTYTNRDLLVRRTCEKVESFFSCTTAVGEN